VVLLKEGTDTSQGTPQLLSNIAACLAVAETLSSTLGPRGMDKLIVNERGEAQITNDGATILKLLEIVHPAAKTLVDIARAQDAEVGDGTTSVVLLAAQMLKEVRGYVEEGVSPHIIMKGFRKASDLVSLVYAPQPLMLMRPRRHYSVLRRSRLPWINPILSM
jgi:T-complex protein 1 subunit eta